MQQKQINLTIQKIILQQFKQKVKKNIKHQFSQYICRYIISLLFRVDLKIHNYDISDTVNLVQLLLIEIPLV